MVTKWSTRHAIYFRNVDRFCIKFSLQESQKCVVHFIVFSTLLLFTYASAATPRICYNLENLADLLNGNRYHSKAQGCYPEVTLMERAGGLFDQLTKRISWNLKKMRRSLILSAKHLSFRTFLFLFIFFMNNMKDFIIY